MYYIETRNKPMSRGDLDISCYHWANRVVFSAYLLPTWASLVVSLYASLPLSPCPPATLNRYNLTNVAKADVFSIFLITLFIKYGTLCNIGRWEWTYQLKTFLVLKKKMLISVAELELVLSGFFVVQAEPKFENYFGGSDSTQKSNKKNWKNTWNFEQIKLLGSAYCDWHRLT